MPLSTKVDDVETKYDVVLHCESAASLVSCFGLLGMSKGWMRARVYRCVEWALDMALRCGVSCPCRLNHQAGKGLNFCPYPLIHTSARPLSPASPVWDLPVALDPM